MERPPPHLSPALDRFARTAAAEAAYEPPPDVTARAKAIFRRHARETEGLARIVARLVYDSFRDPLPVGMRAADRPNQALYEADGFAVDVHIDHVRVGREHGARRMVVVGQVSDRDHPARRLADLPVFLMAGRQVAASGLSNHLGEFHLECEPTRRLQVVIRLDDERKIEVPLHRLSRPRTLERALVLPLALLCSLLGAAPSATAGSRFVVRASRADIAGVCETHDLRPVARLGRDHLWLVEAPDGLSRRQVEERLASDPRVLDVEQDARTRVRTGVRPGRALRTEAPIDLGATDLAGTPAWSGYSLQPAGDVIGLPQVRADGHDGRGAIVAVIDTGVDPDHPLLARSLLPGYDFTRDRAGSASEWADLEQEVVVILERGSTTTTRLSQEVVVIVEFRPPTTTLQQEVVVIVEVKQSGASLLAKETTVPLPSLFGHGTMVAGLIHLVAPQARIMPLKAFRADGTSRPSDIVRAIYHAVDHGAKVINMSFSTESREVRRAIQYATNRGVICVAAAGNDGQETIVYPAALERVLGVASTTLDDERAPFSNYGEKLVKVAAPGEDLITTFPGDMYAAVSGTSFSTGLVAGAAAVLAGVDPHIDVRDAMSAFQDSRYISEDLGWGRIDVPEAVAALAVPRQRGEGRER